MTTIKWSAQRLKGFTLQSLKGLLIVLLLNSTAALAVGFGEITLNSSLNEPLAAEIALTNVDDIEEGMLLAVWAYDSRIHPAA
jgi:Tfp pilus assembly protein FimV